MKPHPLDPFSLIAGVLFTAIGVGCLLVSLDVTSFDLTWIPAIVLIGLGTAAIVAGVSRSRRATELRRTE
jgi:hypothetical protein